MRPTKGGRKVTRGEAAKYISRAAALKKLQITANEFRRLCILKGIYPREPKNRKKAQKGRPGIDVLYLRKDINFITHEPMIWKFRQRQIFLRKLKKAKRRLDTDKVRSVRRTQPKLALDHMIRERYPTFEDALSDLDDPLNLCFLFARVNKAMYQNQSVVQMCRKLTLEFMHYVIAARCLKKVFISVKGYFYQAEIMGHTVTWSVPHPLALVKPRGLNFKVMRIFAEFYVVMLGFVNYRLYQSLNLVYPPQLTKGGEGNYEDLLASLNTPLLKTSEGEANEENEQEEEEDFDLQDLNEGNTSVYSANMERQMEKKQRKLFEGLRFFIGRENNLESLTFIIRAFGGEASWDELTAPGATYKEDDQKITHHIVDRPNMEKSNMSRYYVQPQWLYDSINARTLLPVQDYFPGESLPAHVSPFDTGEEEYIPPEKQRLLALRSGKPIEEDQQKKSILDQEAELDKFKDVEDDDIPFDVFEDYEVVDRIRELDDDYDDLAEDEPEDREEPEDKKDGNVTEKKEKVNKYRIKKMSVKIGRHHKKVQNTALEKMAEENLRKMHMSGKQRRLYTKLKHQEIALEKRREKMAFTRMHLEKAIASKKGGSREQKEKRILSDFARNKRRGKKLS